MIDRLLKVKVTDDEREGLRDCLGGMEVEEVEDHVLSWEWNCDKGCFPSVFRAWSRSGLPVREAGGCGG